MSERNDKLWHDVHAVHIEKRHVLVLRNGEIEHEGYVVAMSNDVFEVAELSSVGATVRYETRWFRFDDAELRLERA